MSAWFMGPAYLSSVGDQNLVHLPGHGDTAGIEAGERTEHGARHVDRFRVTAGA